MNLSRNLPLALLALSSIAYSIAACLNPTEAKTSVEISIGNTVQVVQIQGTPFYKYTYTKDVRANPPICTLTIEVSSGGGGPAIVPCEGLKPYFDSKGDVEGLRGPSSAYPLQYP